MPDERPNPLIRRDPMSVRRFVCKTKPSTKKLANPFEGYFTEPPTHPCRRARVQCPLDSRLPPLFPLPRTEPTIYPHAPGQPETKPEFPSTAGPFIPGPAPGAGPQLLKKKIGPPKIVKKKFCTPQTGREPVSDPPEPVPNRFMPLARAKWAVNT